MNQDVEKLAAFGAWCLDEMRIDGGGDIDGGAAQDAAIRCGVLVYVRVTEPCGPNCWCASYDDFPQECLQRAVGGIP